MYPDEDSCGFITLEPLQQETVSFDGPSDLLGIHGSRYFAVHKLISLQLCHSVAPTTHPCHQYGTSSVCCQYFYTSVSGMYHNNKMTARQIADVTGCQLATVEKWISVFEGGKKVNGDQWVGGKMTDDEVAKCYGALSSTYY